jgi:hypothetical protein
MSLTDPIQTRANWLGQVVTTTANPQRLSAANPNRQGWRAFTLGGGAASGRIGYSDNASQAYIPMPTDGSYPVGSGADAPVEINEIWYHGAAGSIVGFAEA